MNSTEEQAEREAAWNWTAILPPLLFGIVALFLRLWGLDDKSVWMDEAFTAYHSTFSAWELWSEPIANKPPLYYLLTALFWEPGDAAFALRLPVAILGAFSVVLSWYFGKAVAGTRLAFLLALFVLLSDINFHYSQEARHYMLLTVGWLFVVIAMVRMVKAREELAAPRWQELALAGIGTLIMVHAQPIAFIYLAGTVLSYITALVVSGKYHKPFLYLPLVVMGVAAATILPWLPVGMENANEYFSWLKQPDPTQAMIQFTSLFGAKNLVFFGGKGVAMSAGVILLVVSLAGMIRFQRRDNRSLGLFLFGLLLLPPLLIWLTGYYKPLYMLRILTPLHILAMTGMALAVYSLESRLLKLVGATVLAVVLGFSSYGYQVHYRKEAWAGLSGHLQEHISAGDAVLICEKYLYHPLEFYLGEKMPAVYYANPAKRRVRLKISSSDSWQPYRPSANNKFPEVVWVASRHGRCSVGMEPILWAISGNRYSAGESRQGHALTLTPYRR